MEEGRGREEGEERWLEGEGGGKGGAREGVSGGRGSEGTGRERE